MNTIRRRSTGQNWSYKNRYEWPPTERYSHESTPCP